MGKTTLLNVMGFLDKPQGGSLLFDGQDISKWNEGDLEVHRLKDLGFIFQAFYLIPTLTVMENTIYFLSSLGVGQQEALERGRKTLEMLHIWDMRDKKPLELSGGQRQRVAIARALAKQPKVILADEPTANLDHKTAEDIIGVFQSLHKSGKVSFIFSTHDMHLVSYADQVFTLNDGQVVAGARK